MPTPSEVTVSCAVMLSTSQAAPAARPSIASDGDGNCHNIIEPTTQQSMLRDVISPHPKYATRREKPHIRRMLRDMIGNQNK